MVKTLTLLLFTVTCACAQDSLVRFKELTYTSSFEKDIFGHPTDYLGFLLATDSRMTTDKMNDIRLQLERTKSDLLNSGIDKKKTDKKVKIIYDQVHSTYLKKYELENRFGEIFTNGNYNCVTATALYALMLESVQVPYAIKEKPSHVFLVAYPTTENILMETTSPFSGYMNFDDRYKQAFVEILKKQKIIGSSEAESSNIEVLFNKYYFQDENIDLKKLVGLHYSNDALFNNDHGDALKAFQQAEKAYYFYPSHRCQYLLYVFGVKLLSSETITPLEQAKYIGKISRYKDQGITHEMIKGEFINLTADILSRQNNKTLYTQCYTEILKYSSDSLLNEQLAYIYNYENGRVFYNQGNYTRAKAFFGKALLLQPDNVDLGALFIGTLANSFKNAKQNKPVLDTLLMYQKKFPSLKQYNTFNSMLGMAYVIMFGEEYDAGNTVQGDAYRKSFEEMMAGESSLIVNSNAIGNAYSNACVYYFKKGQKAKAREIVKKGLEFAPDSYELRMRQQMLTN